MNFDIGGEKMPTEIIRAFGILKKAAANANLKLGLIDEEKRDLIVKAADEVIEGKLARSFPAGRVADRVGHPVQHERQRGDLEPRDRDGGRGDGIEEADPSQRPRQHEPVVERHLSDGDAYRGGRGDRGLPLPARRDAARDARTQSPKRSWTIVKIGRTHLQDATPITLGQEMSGWVAQIDLAVERDQGDAAAAARAGAGRHGGRHRAQCASGLCEARRGGDLAAHRSASSSPRPTSTRVMAGHDAFVGTLGGAEAACGGVHEDRQRRALAGLGPALGPRRAGDPRERAGLLDHAGQGQPDAVRGDDDGRGAGDGQRHRDRHRREPGQFRAQRLQAGDRLQFPAVGAAARRCGARASTTTARWASSPTGRGSSSWSTSR